MTKPAKASNHWPTNSQLVLAVVRPGDQCTNLRIRECTGIPPLALNGTLGHLCRTGKLLRSIHEGTVTYSRPREKKPT